MTSHSYNILGTSSSLLYSNKWSHSITLTASVSRKSPPHARQPSKSETVPKSQVIILYDKGDYTRIDLQYFVPFFYFRGQHLRWINGKRLNAVQDNLLSEVFIKKRWQGKSFNSYVTTLQGVQVKKKTVLNCIKELLQQPRKDFAALAHIIYVRFIHKKFGKSLIQSSLRA